MKKVDYVRNQFIHEDEVLKGISQGLEQKGMPQISVPPEVGQTLYLLARISGAHKILEIGGLGGYSSIWMAKALPKDGTLLSLEINPEHAAFATENIQKAGLSDKVRYHIGDARNSLEELEMKREQFDFYFIDADKESYPYYLEKVIGLSGPGSVIVMDNMFSRERILDETNRKPSVEAIRQTNKMLAEDSRLESTLLTIGDGLAVARVK
ncbi:O-methyltransferase [Kroppenstedtia pulmonis]|uniref:O-methyltransferase n=1 Tax=Kroppenstedtia pulmonis TaxID=1380685 RepID=A0A7D4CNL2_9BACL|nr:O-methyltransferase [Kroppenstedtia pulmonis]QKG84898.1 O-methyltransferase [Kroppenstedtia pulmonis]